MTENVLQKLEEKIITLLAEMETLRNEIKQLRQENTSLKTEKTYSTDKLKNLITQLDSLISPAVPKRLDHESCFERDSVPA